MDPPFAPSVLDAAIQAARDAGALVVKEFHREGGPRGSGDHAHVDAAAEALIRDRLEAVNPAWGVRGEDALLRGSGGVLLDEQGERVRYDRTENSSVRWCFGGGPAQAPARQPWERVFEKGEAFEPSPFRLPTPPSPPNRYSRHSHQA